MEKTTNVKKYLKEVNKSSIDLIYPVFVKEEIKTKQKAPLPQLYINSINSIVDEIDDAIKHNVNAFLLFGIPAKKDIHSAYKKENIVSQSIRKLKEHFGDKITLFSDVGLSPYSPEGQSVIYKNNKIDVKSSFEIASKMAISYADAGVDFVAPCLSLKEQVKTLREGLNNAGYNKTGIMAYSAKYASSLYGPYRATVDSKLGFKKKEDYQLDYNDYKEGLKVMKTDLREGADIVMVKPGLTYLDIICRASRIIKKPIAVYNVSGEYCMFKSAAEKNWIDEKAALIELVSAFKRSGAKIIITYSAKDIASELK
ncbi:MAG: porphobilinogen synthase [Candidatus Nanohalarchaeota archaeon]|nr:MAG: porphobilinogen synthase [Candidatus Nanohaloarchaeota archaeon]